MVQSRSGIVIPKINSAHVTLAFSEKKSSMNISKDHVVAGNVFESLNSLSAALLTRHM